MILLESKAPHGLASGEALVASVLVLLLAAPSAHAMAPGVQPADSARLQGSSPTSDASLRIEIDAPMTLADAELLRTRIVERSGATASARIAGVEGHEQWIAVRIGGVKFAYSVSAIGMRDGEPVGPAAAHVECRCNSEELLAEVDARVSAAAQALRMPTTGHGALTRASPSPARELTEDTKPVPPREPAMTDVEPVAPRRRAMGPLGYSGIGVGILGAATLGGGIALLLRPDEVRGATGDATGWTTKPAGLAMAVGGSAALTTGVVLLAVDLVRGRERSTSFAPTLGRHEVGLAVTRRF